VHARADYARLTAPTVSAPIPAAPYTAVKFYFNECFPATDENRAFARRTVEEAAARGPVVSLATGLRLDDHDGDDMKALGVGSMPQDVPPQQNLAVQAALVAGASTFVGTYGGFSYMAPFLGVPATAYYSNQAGYSPRHLEMARSALAKLGGPNLSALRTHT
jgi:hypothetical protein